MTIDPVGLLSLLQLASPALPVGAFSYSEGLETLVESGQITTGDRLQQWLTQELHTGGIRLEAAIMVRAYQAARQGDPASVANWNDWLSATRETEELRHQSWQMGRALLRLLQNTQFLPANQFQITDCHLDPCNYAIAFALAPLAWQVNLETASLGYLHSWATNLVSAAVRLIPLGQTIGQQLLLNLQPVLISASQQILTLTDEDLYSCGWGLSLASMNHEILYSRLFRS